MKPLCSLCGRHTLNDVAYAEFAFDVATILECSIEEAIPPAIEEMNILEAFHTLQKKLYLTSNASPSPIEEPPISPQP